MATCLENNRVMKEIFFEISFWLGICTIITGAFLFLLWILGQIMNLLGNYWNLLWNIYEYAVYKRDFNKWLVESKLPRNNRAKRIKTDLEKKWEDDIEKYRDMSEDEEIGEFQRRRYIGKFQAVRDCLKDYRT